MADPFDVTNSDMQPAGGGVSPDFYRNLLSFGLATMSAASQPGAQFLGSLGKGGLAAMESSRSNNQARLQNQLSGAQLQNARFDAAQKLNNINWLRQQQGQPPLDANGQVQSIQANAPQPTGMNTQTDPQIAEPGSTAGASWSPAAGSSSPNQPNSVPTGPSTSTAGSTIGGIPTAIYNKMNPEEQSAAMQANAYKFHNMPDMAKPLEEFAYKRLNASAEGEGGKQSKIDVERAGFSDVRGGQNMPGAVYDRLNNRFVAEGSQTAEVQPGQNIPGPDGKPLAVGTEYRLPPTINPDSNVGPASAQAPIQVSGAAQAPAPSPMPLSANVIAPNNSPAAGMAAFQAAQGATSEPVPPGQAPGANLPGAQPQISVGPQGMTANVPPPASLGGAPPQPPAAQSMPAPAAAPVSPVSPVTPGVSGAMPIKLPPQQEELLKAGTADWLSKSMPLYENANNALGSAKVIDTDIQNLPQTGMLSTGATAKSRVEFAQKINDIQRSMGVSSSSLLFNPDQAASAESLNKEALRLGFADARTLGAKEAASVVDQSIKANPGLQSSPVGIRLLNSTMAEKMQRQKDMIEYQHDQLTQHSVDVMQSEMDFNKKYPISAYIQRGMSQIAPLPIAPSRPGAINGLLPGTRIRLSNEPPTSPGKVIPLTPDYTFSLPPTVHSLEQQGGE